jgi:hypothetical protein
LDVSLPQHKCANCGDYIWSGCVVGDTRGKIPHRWPVCVVCAGPHGERARAVGDKLLAALSAVVIAVATAHFWPAPDGDLVMNALDRAEAVAILMGEDDDGPWETCEPGTTIALQRETPRVELSPPGRMSRNGGRLGFGSDGLFRINSSHGARNPRVDLSEFALTHALNGDLA